MNQDKGRAGEAYILQGAPSQEWFAGRTVCMEAAFLLPHLHPGIDLLDCGCGPGFITVGMAEVVAPGSVVGIDIQPDQIEAARILAEERGLGNVRFEVGDVYQIPFPDASFDAVFANAVLMYLRDPLAALKEMRRVLRPGGVVGIRDFYEKGMVWEPSTPLLKEYRRLGALVMEHNGTDSTYLVRQRRLLLEAGFVCPEGNADSECSGTPETTKRSARFWAQLYDGQARSVILEQGWADEAKIEAMRAEIMAWGEKPDAFLTLPFHSAVGWAPE